MNTSLIIMPRTALPTASASHADTHKHAHRQLDSKVGLVQNLQQQCVSV